MSNRRRRRTRTTHRRTIGEPLAVVPSALTPPPTIPAPRAAAQPGSTRPLPPSRAEAIVGLIATGGLDDDLATLTRAIHHRRREVSQAWSVRALGSLDVGDRVRVNGQVRPQYLKGATGSVAGWSGQRVVVLLDEPVGRFTSGEVRCPPLGLERV